MDEGFLSKRITSGILLHVKTVDDSIIFVGFNTRFWFIAGSIAKYREVEEENFILELRSKKKTNPIALQQVINKAKASNIKIVEGENTRKVTDSDSYSNQSKQLMRFVDELKGISTNPILININDPKLRFTIRELAIIHGLNCSDNESYLL
ncbi:hypothetical protein R3W88_016333 [Solanum pinnatisectum]|uniref:Uncharacterized protein n=1 Tax=Solanum pinnatisectum TaxID=50273 RepID=A0AAV9L073_9SOLN|nr:hypothetical protein R3W88_016333 [Solanum pinnatisectum]